MWQDTLLALCQLAFLPSLLPSIVGKDKPAFWTSATTGTIIAIIGITTATLELWFASIATMATASAWMVLAVQKYRIDKRASTEAQS